MYTLKSEYNWHIVVFANKKYLGHYAFLVNILKVFATNVIKSN